MKAETNPFNHPDVSEAKKEFQENFRDLYGKIQVVLQQDETADPKWLLHIILNIMQRLNDIHERFFVQDAVLTALLDRLKVDKTDEEFCTYLQDALKAHAEGLRQVADKVTSQILQPKVASSIFVPPGGKVRKL